MRLTSMKLISIVAETDLKTEIIQLLKEIGISGYTYLDCKGKGADQKNDDFFSDNESIQFKIVTEPVLAISLMDHIASQYFGKKRIIVYENDVNVIRAEKFEEIKQEKSGRTKNAA